MPAPGAPTPAPPTESFPPSGADFGQPIPAPGAPGAPDDDDASRPAFGAPPPGAPGTEGAIVEKKKSKTWLWVLLGFVGLLVLLGVGCTALLVRAASGPVDAGEDFMELVEAGNGSAAYESLAPLCQTNNRPAFEQLVVDLNVDGFSLNSLPTSLETQQGGTAKSVVNGTATVAGAQQSVRLDMEEVDGDWRVCMFIVGGTAYSGR